MASVRDERTGRWLLLIATLLLLVTSLRDISGPWEHGLRGGVAARYTDVAVAVNLQYGMGVTLGLPSFVIEVNGQLDQNINFHHPPYYWLYATFWGWLLGHTPMALRVGQLLLFFPGLFALYLLVRRWSSPQAAGWSAVMFATAPLIAYYGPMVLQDGAVLGCGLWALWRFQRLCDRPTIGNWLAGAGLFFVAASWDFSGYWWGPAMFVLALQQRDKLRALLQVAGMAPVSVFAFAVTAWHFGFSKEVAEGGGYMHKLLELIHLEGQGIDQTVDLHRFMEAMGVLWLEHFNIVLLVGAVAGLGVAVVFAPLRPLLLVGAAVLLPGLLNYASMFRHAVDHPFWSVHGFAGLAVFAAAVPALASSLRSGVGKVVCLAVGAVVAVRGHVGTHQLVSKFESHDDSDTIAVVRKALPYLDGINTTLTSAPAVTQVQIDHLSMVYMVDSAAMLKNYIELGRKIDVRDEIGFVVHPQHADPELLRTLDGLAPRMTGPDGVVVYRLRLGSDSDTYEVVTKAAPQLGDCTTVMTSAPAIPRGEIGRFKVIYAIDTVAKLDDLVNVVRTKQIRETFGFVVHPKHADPALLARLDALAKGAPIDGGIVVYRLRLVE